MVCGISTKWHGPKTHKTPVRKLSWTPLGTSTEERSSGPRKDPTKQTSRPGRLPTVVPKVDRPRPPPKPMPQRLPSKTPKVKESLPLPLVLSPDRSLSKKMVVPRPLKIMARSKEGKVLIGSPASLPVTSTQATTAKGLQVPPRPLCVLRTTTYRSSVGIMAASKDSKRGVPLKVSSVGQKQSINVGTTKTAGRVEVAETFGKPMVTGSCRTGAPTRNKRLTTSKAIAFPHAVEPPFHIARAQQSPDPSSFPPQSWKIILDIDLQHVQGSIQICGNETLSSMGNVLDSGVAGTAKGLCRCSEPEPQPDSDSDSESESISSSPELSPSPTVVETPESPTGPIIGFDGTVKISTPTQKPSNQASHTACHVTIISRSGNGTSMVKLMKMVDGSQASSPTKISDTTNRTRMCSAVEITRAFLSPSRPGTSTEPTASRTVGADASWLRKLFIGLLHEDTKASKNPTTEIETELFRAQRQVASDGTVDFRLDRLGSPVAMAIIIAIRPSVPDSPGRV